MHIEHMREFLVVADVGSFTKAAAKLFLTQPVLSKHIRGLEEDLGGELFSRQASGLVLTPLGQRAFDSFQEILGCYDELMRDTRRSRADEPRTVRIGMLHLTASRFVLPVVERFEEELAEVVFSYTTGKPHEIMADLLEDRIDIGLVSEGDFDDRGMLSYSRIAQSRFCMAVPSVLFPSGVKEISADDVRDMPIVCLKYRDTTDYMNRRLRFIGFDMQECIQVDELDIALAEVSRSRACFALPEFLAPQVAMYPDLLMIPITPATYQDIFFARKRQNTDPSVINFINFAAS